MGRAVVAFFLVILCCYSLRAQVPNPAALAKVKTAALVIRATSSVSCGDGSEGTCVRNDSDVEANVRTYVDGTELWQHFDKAEATKADAILEFTVKSAKTTYGRISFSVRDADTNNVLYSEDRAVVMLENDIVRVVNHLLKAVDDAKKKPLVPTKIPKGATLGPRETDHEMPVPPGAVLCANGPSDPMPWGAILCKADPLPTGCPSPPGSCWWILRAPVGQPNKP